MYVFALTWYYIAKIVYFKERSINCNDLDAIYGLYLYILSKLANISCVAIASYQQTEPLHLCVDMDLKLLPWNYDKGLTLI